MAAPTGNIDRTKTVTCANPTPPTNVVVNYQGTPPTPRGLAPTQAPAPDTAQLWLFADPLNGATAPELAGKAEGDGTEVTTTVGNSIGHSTLGAFTEAPNTSHPSQTDGTLPGFPNALTTGVQDGITLTARGDWTITASGTYQNFDVSGFVIINASNVTLRNCRVRPLPGQTGGVIYVSPSRTGVIIEYCDIDGRQVQGLKGVWIETSNGVIVRYNDISHCEDGVYAWGDNTQIRDNYIHDLDATNPDPHYDCVQFSGVGIVIDHNTMIGAVNANSIAQFSNNTGPIGVTFNNNLMRPGPVMLYLLNCGDVTSPPACTYNVTNNSMEAGHSLAAGQKYVTWNVNRPATWTGNVDADTGAAIPPPP